MKLSNFLIVKAAIWAVLGVVFLLVPAAFMSVFGPTLDSAGEFMARSVGALLIGIGLICWLERNAHAPALQNITLALFIADALGFIVALLAQLAGLTNTVGWLNVLVWLFMAAGLGYFRFVKPPAS